MAIREILDVCYYASLSLIIFTGIPSTLQILETKLTTVCTHRYYFFCLYLSHQYMFIGFSREHWYLTGIGFLGYHLHSLNLFAYFYYELKHSFGWYILYVYASTVLEAGLWICGIRVITTDPIEVGIFKPCLFVFYLSPLLDLDTIIEHKCLFITTYKLTIALVISFMTYMHQYLLTGTKSQNWNLAGIGINVTLILLYFLYYFTVQWKRRPSEIRSLKKCCKLIFISIWAGICFTFKVLTHLPTYSTYLLFLLRIRRPPPAIPTSTRS